MAVLGPIQYFIWNSPFIWINAFLLINGHGQYLSKYCNPAIGKVDEMVKTDTSQVNSVNYWHKNKNISEQIKMECVMQCEATSYKSYVTLIK